MPHTDERVHLLQRSRRQVGITATLATVPTWKEDIVAALHALGGTGHYDEIYAEVAALRGSPPASWQAIIRRTIEQSSSDSALHRAGADDLFFSVEGIGRGIWGLRDRVGQQGATGGSLIAQNPDSGQGYALNSVVREAIEMYAVERAEEHYTLRGASNIDRVGKPYDLRVTMPGRDLHVEVKGSTRSLTSVILTRNEVQHARATVGTELLVVDDIKLTTDPKGKPILTGGRQRCWRGWSPADQDLTPTVYLYTLPAPQR